MIEKRFCIKLGIKQDRFTRNEMDGMVQKLYSCAVQTRGFKLTASVLTGCFIDWSQVPEVFLIKVF